MSDINISGVPNMGFGGGGYFGGNAALGLPAMGSNAIMGSMGFGAGGVGDQSQAQLNNIFNNFGKQTDYYSALGAAYGRATGGFGAPGSNPGWQTPAGGMGSVFDTGAAPFNSYSGGANPGSFSPSPNYPGGHSPSPWEGAGFDPVKYLNANPDVRAAGADPWEHAQRYGFSEGRSGLGWNPLQYLADNPDVKAAGVNPWEHAEKYGFNEGRSGLEGLTRVDITGGSSGLSPLGSYQGTGFDAFDPNIYGGSHPTAGFGQQPTAAAPQQNWDDLWKDRGPFNRSPQQGAGANAGQDAFAAAYYAANPDVYAAGKASGQDPDAYARQHIMAYGADEGRQFFDRDAYLRQNPDVAAAGVDPTAHWFNYGQKEGRAEPTAGFNYAGYLAANPDVLAAGVDPMAHWLEYGQNEKRQGALGANQNTLAAQRNAFAESVRTNPNLANQLAARLYSEDQNNPDTRVAILETMMNRLNATGQNPLNPKYYPSDATSRLPQALNTVTSNNDLLNQIYQEMERAWGGSNLSNYATDWASGDVAANAAKYSTPTWTSPSNEQFFRKDISNDYAGAGTAAQNQRWYGQFAK